MESTDWIDSLLNTALYDTGGESVEGAFVDHWVSNASEAIESLEKILKKHGFQPAAAERFRKALSAPGCPPDAARYMLTWLKRWTAPLIAEMLGDPEPAIRAIAVRAAGEVLPPDQWSQAFQDPSPIVRAAAIQTTSTHRSARESQQREAFPLLQDPDASVREAAARSIPFFNHPDGGKALAAQWKRDPEPRVRHAIVRYVSDETTSYTGSAPIEGRVGGPLTEMLISELDNEDAEIREAAALGLRKFNCLKVAEALYRRLRVERNRDVQVALLRNYCYYQLGDRALDLFRELLARDPDAAVRTEAAFHLPSFGIAAEAALVAALRDTGVGPRRAAIMSLGRMGRLLVLPAVLGQASDASDNSYLREFESAVRDITIVEDAPGGMPPVSPELSERIRQRIRSLTPDSPNGFAGPFCKQELNSLPIHTAHYRLWSLTPEGTILCSEYVRIPTPTEEETEPLARFAVMVQAARVYPELAEIIPPPPRNAWLCACLGRGWRVAGDQAEECKSCSGFGWYQRE